MKIIYCMECAKLLQKQDDSLYICPEGHEFWNSPNAGASVIFLKDNQILLSKRGIEPRKGFYSLPGGFLKYGESAADAAVREMHEETGVTVTELKIFDSRTVPYNTSETSCAVIFLALAWEGEFVPDDDSDELVWKPIEFADSDQFAWPYPGLTAKLKVLLSA